MHDELEDHGLEISPNGQSEATPAAGTGSPGFVPLAEPVAGELEHPDFTPSPEGPSGLPGIPLPEGLQRPVIPIPWPGLHFCLINLRAGCYRISFQPTAASSSTSGR